MIRNTFKSHFERISLDTLQFNSDNIALPSLPQLSDADKLKVTALLKIISDTNSSNARKFLVLAVKETPILSERAPLITWSVTEACSIAWTTSLKMPLLVDENRQIVNNLSLLLSINKIDHLLPVLKGFHHFITDYQLRTLDLSDTAWSGLIDLMIDSAHDKIFASRRYFSRHGQLDSSRIFEPQLSSKLMRDICTNLLDNTVLGRCSKDGKDQCIRKLCKNYVEQYDNMAVV